MKLVYQKRDITTLDRKKCVIAHAISTDTAMGSGVVVPIKGMHTGLKTACKKYSESNNRDVLGKAFRYVDEKGTTYNLFTKKDVYDKAGVGMTVEDYHRNLKNSFIDLKNQMIKNNEVNLGIPQIGCGLDRCNWEDVKEIIDDVFRETDIYILVCLWGDKIQYPKNAKVW